MSDDEYRAVVERFRVEAERRGTVLYLALFLVQSTMGLRITQALSLRLGQIWSPLAGRVADRVYFEARTVKKRVSGQEFEIIHEIRPVLAVRVGELLERGFGPEAFFFAAGGRGDRSISRVAAWREYKKVYLACGLYGKLATHTARKTCGRLAWELSGHDVMSAQRALRHKNLNSTAQYLDPVIGESSRVLQEKFGKLLKMEGV